MGSTAESLRGTQMLKFVVVAAVVAFAVGIVVGLNASSDGAPSGEQVFSSASPAIPDVARPGNTSPIRMSDVEKLDAEITLLDMLEKSIAKRNDEYETLNKEIARLLMIKVTLEGELGEAVFISGAASGR